MSRLTRAGAGSVITKTRDTNQTRFFSQRYRGFQCCGKMIEAQIDVENSVVKLVGTRLEKTSEIEIPVTELEPTDTSVLEILDGDEVVFRGVSK